MPTHTIANFIIKNLLDRSGPLISEKLLAIRLGVDIEKSHDWPELLKLFSFKYKGVFFQGWNRWWMSGIEAWWKQHFEGCTLRSSSAVNRIEKLSAKTGLTQLVPISKSRMSKSDCFWTICIGSGIPIDTVDGLLIEDTDSKFPWQDKIYISVDEALQPKNKSVWKEVAATEELKLQILKKLNPNERPKA